MSSISDSNKEIFKRLECYIPDHMQHNVILEDPKEERIIRATKEELDIIRHGKVVEQFFLFPNKPVVKIRYSNKSAGIERYFVVIPECIDEDMGDEPFMKGVIGRFNDNHSLESDSLLNDNAGLLTLLWAQVQNYPHRHFNEMGELLVDKVFGILDFIDLDIMKIFFKECDIWEVEQETFNLSAYSLYGGWLTNSSSNLSINFIGDTLIKYRQLFEESFGSFIAEPLFRSLTSTHHVHSFLECYRCIERLYHVPFVKELLHLTKDDTTTSELAKLIESKLKWRPKEEDALIKLIEFLDDSQLNSQLYDELE